MAFFSCTDAHFFRFRKIFVFHEFLAVIREYSFGVEKEKDLRFTDGVWNIKLEKMRI